MKVVLPSESHSNYMFECPHCGWPCWLYEEEINDKVISACCSCGRNFKPRISEYKPPEVENNDNYRQAELALNSQGYSIFEAKQMLKVVYTPEKSLQSLVQDAILHGRTQTSKV